MKVYICTIQASRKQRHEIYTVCSWIATETADEATATGIAYMGCKEKFPVIDGWGHHSVCVEEIPQNAINMVLRVYFPDLWEKELQP